MNDEGLANFMRRDLGGAWAFTKEIERILNSVELTPSLEFRWSWFGPSRSQICYSVVLSCQDIAHRERHPSDRELIAIEMSRSVLVDELEHVAGGLGHHLIELVDELASEMLIHELHEWLRVDGKPVPWRVGEHVKVASA